MPTAVKTPGDTGMRMRRISSAAATSHACTGPLPPKAISVKSRGSRPRSIVTDRIARALRVQLELSAGEMVGVQVAERDVGVGDGGTRAADAVARGPRPRAGGLG